LQRLLSTQEAEFLLFLIYSALSLLNLSFLLRDQILVFLLSRFFAFETLRWPFNESQKLLAPRFNQGLQSGRAPQSRPIPCRLLARPFKSGSCISKVTICDLKDRTGRTSKYRQLAFTEHGAIMAATILNSPRAEQMSVYVVRAFVKMRESLAAHTVLSRELATLKSRVDTLDADTRSQFDQVYEAILGLMSPGVKKQ
jgi:hypothetical protein